jgi:hypothetical protein
MNRSGVRRQIQALPGAKKYGVVLCDDEWDYET